MIVIIQTVNISLHECVRRVKMIVNTPSTSLTLKVFSVLYLPEPEYHLVVAEHFNVLLLQNLQQLLNQISLHPCFLGFLDEFISF